MATGGKSVAALERRWEEVRAALGAVGELRPGALVGRYRPCGKPTCHCAQPGDPGHGPCWSLTRVVGGKTVTRSFRRRRSNGRSGKSPSTGVSGAWCGNSSR